MAEHVLLLPKTAPDSLHIFVFACPQCHVPVIASRLTDYQNREPLDSETFSLKCPVYLWEGECLGATASERLTAL
jgi:hypothetical protein